MPDKIIQVTNQIVHLHYDCGFELHRAFGRFQAFYDGPDPKFREYFTREFFDVWVDRFPLWSAPWVGCNVPGWVFREVARFPDLSKEEIAVLKAVDGMPEKSYATATNAGGSLLRHELCHALWYVDSDYSKKATEVLEELPDLERELQSLRDMGYKNSSLMDEANAYSGDHRLSELFDETCAKHGFDVYEILEEIFEDDTSKRQNQ